jgi:hypothetical protein
MRFKSDARACSAISETRTSFGTPSKLRLTCASSPFFQFTDTAARAPTAFSMSSETACAWTMLSFIVSYAPVTASHAERMHSIKTTNAYLAIASSLFLQV